MVTYTIPARRRNVVERVVPFATSVLLHAAIILLGILTYRAIEIHLSPMQEQVIIPDATIIDGAAVGGIPNPGLGDDPLRRAAQAELPEEPAREDAWATRDDLSMELAGGGDTTHNALIAVGGRRAFGSGDSLGPSAGSGGDLAMFGVPGGGGGLGPAAPFVGISGNARRVVYLCDATGGIVWGTRFNLLKSELRLAIDVLRPIQSFNVIFFTSGGAVQAVDPGSLVVANAGNKRRAYDFIERTAPSGETNPIPAIQMAFRQNPELIYFLTDADFAASGLTSQDAVQAEIRRLNRDGRVRINTIAFLADERQRQVNREQNEAWLKQIAQENGGVYKSVSREELRR